MNIHSIRALPGPNIFCHRPMLAMELELGELYAIESYEVPGFIERLLTLLPGMYEHHCASGKPGGFIRRLHEGTYFGHIVEHVALELTDAVGISVNRGKTVSTDVPGRYLVTVEYKCEAGMRHLLETAVGLVDALVHDEPYPLQQRLDDARAVIAKAALGPSTKAIVDAATARGIPWVRVNNETRIRLGTGAALRHIDATMTDRTSVIAVDLAANKHETKRVLRAVGLPVPDGSIVETRDEVLAAFASMTPPVVVKPLDANQGKGVSLNLRTPEQVSEAFDLAKAISKRAIIEQMFTGNDYRLVIVNGRMVAAAQRIPAHVRGDGVHNIRELIDLANHDPRRGDDHEKPMTKITADPLVLAILKRHGRALSDVPAPGELVLLRDSANLSTGGEARDVTDAVHPTIRVICERAARAIGLDVCGVDLVVRNIEQRFTAGGIVEVNAAPGIRMHHFPSEGEPRDVGGAIVDMLFPVGTPSRIPVAAITGTNGKTTVTRMLAHMIRKSGRTVGMTTTDGIWIGDQQVAEGDLTGPWSANVVLSDPSVEVAVLETARGGIIRNGLGFDWADVSVITNIQNDHVGQDGIDTLDDIARVKRLIAERVRAGGTLVVNADDERTAAMALHPTVTLTPKHIVYFSLSPMNPIVTYHLQRGGTVLVMNGEYLEERKGDEIVPLTSITSVPAAFGGAAAFQIANALAAAAAARALGVDRDVVIAGLESFGLCEHNSGRLNVFDVAGGTVVVDYGHNPQAIRSATEFALRLRGGRTVAMLGVPGDRIDDQLRESARALAGVDKVIVREDADLRGRAPGHVSKLLCDALRQHGVSSDVSVVLAEREAVDATLDVLRDGDVALMFVEDIGAVLAQLRARGATAASPAVRAAAA